MFRGEGEGARQMCANCQHSVDNLSAMTREEQGELIRSEHLKDGAGGHGLEERRDVLPFYRLVRRFGGLE